MARAPAGAGTGSAWSQQVERGSSPPPASGASSSVACPQAPTARGTLPPANYPAESSPHYTGRRNEDKGSPGAGTTRPSHHKCRVNQRRSHGGGAGRAPRTSLSRIAIRSLTPPRASGQGLPAGATVAITATDNNYQFIPTPRSDGCGTKARAFRTHVLNLHTRAALPAPPDRGAAALRSGGTAPTQW